MDPLATHRMNGKVDKHSMAQQLDIAVIPQSVKQMREERAKLKAIGSARKESLHAFESRLP